MRRIRKRFAGRARLAIEALENRVLLSTAAYTWQNAAIGAGGFLDGVFFDPNNNGVMYARTDIGGLYKTTNGGNNWNQLLNFVGNDFGGTSSIGQRNADLASSRFLVLRSIRKIRIIFMCWWAGMGFRVTMEMFFDRPMRG